MTYSICYNKLSKLSTKLDEYFTPNYGTNVVESFQKSNTKTSSESNSGPSTVHIHHHHSHSHPLFEPYVPFLYRPYMMTSPTTIINNYPQTSGPYFDVENKSSTSSTSKNDKEEKKDKQIQSTMGGFAIISATSLAGTYLLATDEYTNYSNSEIEIDINNLLSEIKVLMKSEPDIIESSQNIKSCFDQWIYLFTKRTYPARNAKGAGILSALSVGGALWYGSTMIMLGGGLGVVASGCYFTWNYFTKKTKTEAELFNDLCKAIFETQSIISEKYSQSISATYPVDEPPVFNSSIWSDSNSNSSPNSTYNPSPTTSWNASQFGYDSNPSSTYNPSLTTSWNPNSTYNPSPTTSWNPNSTYNPSLTTSWNPNSTYNPSPTTSWNASPNGYNSNPSSNSLLQ